MNDRAMIQTILAPLDEPPRLWIVLVAVCALGTLLWITSVGYTLWMGIGAWGNNIPVAWAFDIVNFVWWIGIGHAGTFISAFLLLLNQPWRDAVARMAEAMTLFALAIAASFPLVHLGRPWFFYWLTPYPSTMGVWPNFKSALPWDVAAITTYFLVSLMFFYLGLVPDLATARDRLTGTTRRRIYGVFALGWNGGGRQWRRRRAALKMMAAIAAALVVSVHSIVSLDFSIAQLPGWHSTIFPPYFVVGAIYSGLAMVLALAVPVRAAYRLEAVITLLHLERLAKLLLTIGLLLVYCDAIELYTAASSHDPVERAMHMVHWPFGPFGWLYWTMLALTVLTPQLFWFRRFRCNVSILFGAAVAILMGMWLERFVIVVASLSRGGVPSKWHDYVPTWVDWGILFGSLSIFGLFFLLFLRFVPAAAMGELRRSRFEMLVETKP
ncbi:MAG TPA: NrfD/PsrC family molybdoenzyme membrane anchor subunit [Vicinamibacterales bacterium]|nr:NrfD/PsrC family molybdoenzyme membrane anchor subunit [Vicinamibacterales bacterium]